MNLVIALLSFVLGVFCFQQMPFIPNVKISLVCTVIVFLVWGCYRLKNKHSVFYAVEMLVFGLMMGFVYALYIADSRLSKELASEFEGLDIHLIGTVSSLPKITEDGERIILDVDRLLSPKVSVPEHISISNYTRHFVSQGKGRKQVSPLHFHAGERWRLVVRLKRPHGNYNPYGGDTEKWMLERNIRATGYIRENAANVRLDQFVLSPPYLIERYREVIRSRIHEVLPESPNQRLLAALVMGDDASITDAQWQIFLRTGVNHLMSISGLHITMLAGMAYGAVYAMWRRSSRLLLLLPAAKVAAFFGLVVAVAYALIAGFSIPTQRTVYMLAVLSIALMTGRNLAMSLVLSIALFVVCVEDPWAVTSPGFWLSFSAVALLSYATSGQLRRPNWWRESLQTQWVVTLGLTPFLLLLFQQVSIVSPLANAFAIPLISFIVTPLALVGSLLPLDFLLHLADIVMGWNMWLLTWCSTMPEAVWQQHAPPIWTFIAAIVGVFWILLPKGFPMRWLGGLACMPMLMILPAPPATGNFKLTVLDVGQGLSVFVQTAKHQLLYDTGPKYSETSDSGKSVILPFLRGSGVAHLDGFILSHDDLDHTGGAATVMTAVPFDWMLSSLKPDHALLKGVPKSFTCFAGQHWVWDGVSFEVMHPSFESYRVADIKDNDRGCVVKISNHYHQALLAADIERSSESALVESQASALAATVLVAPHHGSKTSSTPAFLSAVHPQMAIFSAGYLNRFHHPNPEIVARYQSQGINRLFRTDHGGAVVVDFDQLAVHVSQWRQEAPHYWLN